LARLALIYAKSKETILTMAVCRCRSDESVSPVLALASSAEIVME
jgi:hypothetical protein